MSHLWTKIVNVSPDTSMNLYFPSCAASLSLWFCGFGFHSGACWVTHIPLLHPGGIGDDIRDDGKETVASPETS